MELCFLTNMSSSDWAAWVQAVGSIGAIVGTAVATRYQVQKQYALADETQTKQVQDRQLAALERLEMLGIGLTTGVAAIQSLLPDREAVHTHASAKWFDLDGFIKFEAMFDSFPVADLPSGITNVPILLSGHVHQILNLLRHAREDHRLMDGPAFGRFFDSLASILQDSIESTTRATEAKKAAVAAVDARDASARKR